MDAEAEEYERFVRARTPALLRSAYLLTGDQYLAEDLVQEALARTHRAWGRLRSSGNAEAYTRKVLYHTQVSTWRRQRVGEWLPGDLPEATVQGGDQGHAIAVRVALQRVLASLSPRQRAVLVLRYFEDRTEAEAAELLGVAISTVKTQAARALDRLRAVPELQDLAITDGAGW